MAQVARKTRHCYAMSSRAVSRLAQRANSGEIVLIDGATGTDIERRGVPMIEGAWCGGAHLSHPDDVRQVHVDHIKAGAELIIANTYASSRHLLAAAGIEEHFEELNRRAVELAIEARDAAGRPDVLVGGSMSTTAQGGTFPSVETATVNFAAQAKILTDAGSDIIVLEMMRDIEQTEPCLAAAIATDLPIWMGISCIITDGVPMMWEGTVTLEAFMQRFKDEPFEVLAIMHTEVDDIDACLDVVQQHWDGPIAVYAQSGRFDPPVWVFIDVISPEDYGTACLRWVDRGVHIVGGCCGVGFEHIAHLRNELNPT